MKIGTLIVVSGIAMLVGLIVNGSSQDNTISIAPAIREGAWGLEIF
jgi:hypothetical protein